METIAVRSRGGDYATREDVLAVQNAKLAGLGKRLAASGAWREHFSRAGLRPDDLADRQALAVLPTLEKADVHSRYPFPFLTVPVAEIVRFCATSGTTGLPVLFGFTRHDWQSTMCDQLSRVFRTAGIVPGDRVYQGYGYGLWIGGSSMDEALRAYGAVNFPIGPGRGELVVQWMRDHAYTATTMSPLWLMTLISLARKAGIDPGRDWKMRVGLFGGQSVSATFRSELEAAMPSGFIAHNIYGSTEAGGPILGVSCEHSHANDEMHLINDDSVLTEVLHPETLLPVGPGEIGEIVITTLDKEASPVVRWRTRDLVRLAEHPFECPCGRSGFPLIGRIIGRSDDMLKIRGVMVYPSQIEDVIAQVGGTVKEAWQIYLEQTAGRLDSLEIAIERSQHCLSTDDALVREVEAGLKARLGLSCRVTCHSEGVLPRYESKATRVIVRASADHGRKAQ
ncbi:phenylacetate--CoA ligase family protein [Burkholderia sp. S171]|uniref:phenylacetate--CoA ligase family protein n=1 Tax=Burkholderia sp. S171 TaxID=1641860 RepID=UPI00131C4C4C|nr:AMP-binding protein [Burkholderia sp. S171]